MVGMDGMFLISYVILHFYPFLPLFTPFYCFYKWSFFGGSIPTIPTNFKTTWGGTISTPFVFAPQQAGKGPRSKLLCQLITALNCLTSTT